MKEYTNEHAGQFHKTTHCNVMTQLKAQAQMDLEL